MKTLFPSFKELVPIKKALGKTIESVYTFEAEYGRTYDTYIGIVFTDGTRSMLGTNGSIYLYYPSPSVKTIRENCPGFFRPGELEEAERIFQNNKEEAAKKRCERELRDYNNLKKSLQEKGLINE